MLLPSSAIITKIVVMTIIMNIWNMSHHEIFHATLLNVTVYDRGMALVNDNILIECTTNAAMTVLMF